MGRKKVNLDGQRFGKLVAIRRSETKQGQHYMYECICDCGTSKLVQLGKLRGGFVSSCGCLAVKHGMHGSATYRTWNQMIQRCTNPNSTGYEYYGGRGIRVCERWFEFTSFLADMGKRPEGMSIDRIDNDGDYCPENCRWATREQQASNTSRNNILTYEGKSQNLMQWSNELGINYSTLRYRIRKGWNIEDILFKPIDEAHRR